MSLSFPSCHPSEILISFSLYADILYGVYGNMMMIITTSATAAGL